MSDKDAAKKVETEEISKPVDAIKVKGGLIAPSDHKELGQLISTIALGGGFPVCFDTHEKRIASYNLARGLMGESWQLALNNMYYIKGKLTIFGELPRAIAERTMQVQEFKVYAVDKELLEICLKNKNLNADPFAGVCEVQRKGRSLKQYTYTIDEAKKAGQYPPKRRDGSINDDSPWEKATRVMLMRKAQAMAVKFEFPDSLLGVGIAEYDHDLAPDLVPIKNVYNPGTNNPAEELNNVFAKDVTNDT